MTKRHTLPVFFFLFLPVFICPIPSYAFYTHQPAEVVVGQPDMTSYTASQSSTGPSTLYNPSYSYSDGSRLIVADTLNNRVLIYNNIPTANKMPATMVIGQADFHSSQANRGGAVAANTLSAPSGLYFDGTRLFIADSGNNRVLIYNQLPSEYNTPADIVIGQPNMTSKLINNGGIGANTLYYPHKVIAAGSRLIISDYLNHRVLIFDSIPATHNASADVVVGQSTFTGNTYNPGGVGANTLFAPTGIYSNGTNLLIADMSNHRVLIYDSIPTTNNASANVVIGQPNMTSNTPNNGGRSAKSLYGPYDICSDGTRLFIADYYNKRALIFNSIPTLPFAEADLVIGKPNMTDINPYDGADGGADGLSSPNSAQYSSNKLFITDVLQNRLLIYSDITLTPTPSHTPTPSYTPTPSHTPTPSCTPTITLTPSYTPTITLTPTHSATYTHSPTITLTYTHSPSPTITASRTVTLTLTYSPTITPFVVDKKTVFTYPSPATGNVLKFYYQINGQAKVTISIYNIAGEKITTLDNTHFSGEFGTTTWNIANVASGMYLYQFVIEDQLGKRILGPNKLTIVKP